MLRETARAKELAPGSTECERKKVLPCKHDVGENADVDCGYEQHGIISKLVRSDGVTQCSVTHKSPCQDRLTSTNSFLETCRETESENFIHEHTLSSNFFAHSNRLIEAIIIHTTLDSIAE